MFLELIKKGTPVITLNINETEYFMVKNDTFYYKFSSNINPEPLKLTSEAQAKQLYKFITKNIEAKARIIRFELE